ncbi:LysM peptidoglycan-binding domain-containing protein [Jeotgalibacillus marinus]|uniref:LysM peptidoglycan-binding domain-containing protein n=1 Tax=Jeotgalibacillus marinus TaxID=86667 RepID=A0ABV3Q966_9BACL
MLKAAGESIAKDLVEYLGLKKKSSGGSSSSTHTVKYGDTLSEIAQDHGMTTKSLADLNGIKDYIKSLLAKY